MQPNEIILLGKYDMYEIKRNVYVTCHVRAAVSSENFDELLVRLLHRIIRLEKTYCAQQI